MEELSFVDIFFSLRIILPIHGHGWSYLGAIEFSDILPFNYFGDVLGYLHHSLTFQIHVYVLIPIVNLYQWSIGTFPRVVYGVRHKAGPDPFFCSF